MDNRVLKNVGGSRDDKTVRAVVNSAVSCLYSAPKLHVVPATRGSGESHARTTIVTRGAIEGENTAF